MFSKIGVASRNSSIVLIRRESSTSSLTAFKAFLNEQIDGIKSAGTFKNERVIVTKQGSHIKVAGNNKDILNFCANNYLGLSSHPEVINASKYALDKYGAGLSSVRFICGTQDIHKSLEQQLAKFHGREDTILYASCFDANAGIFETLMAPEDAIVSDELNHASIIDGIRLSKAKRLKYKHKDMGDLEAKLKEASGSRFKLIATDGVFSMDGNVAPLNEICNLAEKYNALVFVDECHATGFFGATGRGTEEYLGVDRSRIHIINSTLGKALGGAAGGYTTSCKEIVALLRQRSRPYLFSNTLPPSVVAGAAKAIELITKDTSLPKKVAENTARFRGKMTALGFKISGENHAISPVMLGDAKLASQFADMMLNEGIYVIGFSYPVVPKGKARIRVQISASHTFDDIDRCVRAFEKIGKALKAI